MILVALGSNISGPWGTPRETVERALVELPRHGIHVLRQSGLIVTAPMGPQDQPDFVNAVVSVRTAKSPETLLRTLHIIEKRAGRVRRLRWGPRTLDLDVVAYHNQRRQLPIDRLNLPHPGLSHRTFVLSPISEIAPNWRHPLTRETADFMLRKLYRLNGA
jgi:2-amino-4-hydroxy-6-hydroxymethyldihydropteridine diphosphokinase